MLSPLATEAGRSITVCSSSYQQGTPGSVMETCIPDAEMTAGCACNFKAWRRHAVVSASWTGRCRVKAAGLVVSNGSRRPSHLVKRRH
jgi:hypothetical protein